MISDTYKKTTKFKQAAAKSLT